MKNHIRLLRNTFIALLSLFLCSSCEEILEVDLPNSQVNRSDVFEDPATAKAALAQLYSDFGRSALFNGGVGRLTYSMSLYTDELTSYYPAGSQDYLNTFPYYNNVLSGNDASPQHPFWNVSYTNIYKINALIEGVSSSTKLSDAIKTTYLGEAYFLRAMYYQQLCQLYGSVPYVTTTDYRVNSSIAKIPYDAVLSKVETDLLAALERIAPDYRNPSRFYPNKAVVELTLAKNYLLQKNYAEAIVYAQKVLDNPLYQSMNDLNTVFKKTATSTLWQLQRNNTNGSDEANSHILTSVPPVTASLSTTLIQNFAPTDARLEHWTNHLSDGINTYYYAYKYKTRDTGTDECTIVYRIEEANFIKAEALAYQNKTDEAAETLDDIRLRANQPIIARNLSKEAFIDVLVAESQREFFTEGAHRFFDLKRNNRLHILEDSKLNWKPQHRLLPYPDKQLLLNPNLNPQNEF